MDTMEILEFIEQNEPVNQDVLTEQFGANGLLELRDLMEKNKVSYNLEWDLISERTK